METNQKLSFEQLPVAVAEIREELRELRKMMSDGAKGSAVDKKDARKLIGVERACEIVGKARNTLYRYTAHGLIPCYKRGKQIYFFEDELLEWVKNGKCDTIEEMEARTDSSILRLASRGR